MKSIFAPVLAVAILLGGACQEDTPKQGDAPKSTEIPKALLDPSLPEWKEKAPADFKVKFETSQGDFIVQVERAWAPVGADRFHGLVKNGFYDDVRFFRVVSGFMAQFGINGSPKVSAAWRDAKIADDPVVKSNLRGWLSFATSGPNSRTTQIFINFVDKNKFLDDMKFSPFGKVVEGMEVVDKLYKEYGDGPPRGQGPNQAKIQSDGNAYLNAEFKKLDYVKTARIVPK